jgi:hypothetical protein
MGLLTLKHIVNKQFAKVHYYNDSTAGPQAFITVGFACQQ